MRSPRLPILIALLIYCIGAKVLSHHAATMSELTWFPWNFSPIYALGLFSAAMYRPKFWAYLAVPLAFLLGDALIAATDTLHDGFRLLPTTLNYLAILGFIGCGALIRGRTLPHYVALSGAAGGLLFYALTNFGSWWYDPQMPTPVGYSRDLAGLLHCYILGIPFAYGTFASILLFAAAFFSPLGRAALTTTASQSEPLHHTSPISAPSASIAMPTVVDR